MGRALVTLVNPNKVHPGITPYALDILTTSLEEADFDVHVVDLTFRRDVWRSVLLDYFASHKPLLIGVTVRNTDTIYPQEQRCFIQEHKEIIDEIRRLSEAPVIAGGVGFSSMPVALTDWFEIDYGVKGPGEIVICEVAERLLTKRPVDDIPGLIVRDAKGTRRIPGDSALIDGRVAYANRRTPYRRRSGDRFKVDNLQYYQRGGLGNILTKNGCSFGCTHCVEPDAKGNHFARRSVTAVVDELEMLTRQGVHDVHSSDSEFNLSMNNTKEILREIIARKKNDLRSSLHSLRLWVYTQPRPFDEELAVLLAQAGCRGVNLSTDHMREDILKGWKVAGDGKRFYTYEDTKNVTRWIMDNGMQLMIEVMIGMPGETIETVYDCIDATLALNATVVGYTFGIRIFPYSPLGIEMTKRSAGKVAVPGVQSNTATRPIILKTLAQCRDLIEYERQFMFEEDGNLRPLYYFSPGLPESPETLASPSGRWLNTLQLMWDRIPAHDHHRVMLPTIPGNGKDDNNYADNPFLLRLVEHGYKGAFWSNWRNRDRIIRERSMGVVPHDAELALAN